MTHPGLRVYNIPPQSCVYLDRTYMYTCVIFCYASLDATSLLIFWYVGLRTCTVCTVGLRTCSPVPYVRYYVYAHGQYTSNYFLKFVGSS